MIRNKCKVVEEICHGLIVEIVWRLPESGVGRVRYRKPVIIVVRFARCSPDCTCIWCIK